MAGLYGPKDAFVLVDGYDLTASKAKTLRRKIISVLEESTGLGDNWEEHTPTGQKRGEFAVEGAFFDTTSDRSHDALSGSVASDPQGTARVASFGFAGETTGNEFDGFEGVFQLDYEVMAQRGELQKANAAYQVTGAHDRGQILQPLANQTADWDTQSSPADYVDYTSQQVIPITSNSAASPTVVTTPIEHGLTTGDVIVISGSSGSSPDDPNGEQTVTVIDATSFSLDGVDCSGGGGTGGSFVRADSSNGGVGYLQVTAASGFTNFIGTIQDSSDDITYASLVAFTDNVSAPFAERVTVAGQVDRYLAFDGNVTGTGSITVFCGFARN